MQETLSIDKKRNHGQLVDDFSTNIADEENEVFAFRNSTQGELVNGLIKSKESVKSITKKPRTTSKMSKQDTSQPQILEYLSGLKAKTNLVDDAAFRMPNFLESRRVQTMDAMSVPVVARTHAVSVDVLAHKDVQILPGSPFSSKGKQSDRMANALQAELNKQTQVHVDLAAMKTASAVAGVLVSTTFDANDFCLFTDSEICGVGYTLSLKWNQLCSPSKVVISKIPLSARYQSIYDSFLGLEAAMMVKNNLTEWFALPYLTSAIERATGNRFGDEELSLILSVFPEAYELKYKCTGSKALEKQDTVTIQYKSVESLSMDESLSRYEKNVHARRALLFESRLFAKAFACLFEQVDANESIVKLLRSYQFKSIRAWPIKFLINVIEKDKLPVIVPFVFPSKPASSIMSPVKHLLKFAVEKRCDSASLIQQGVALRTHHFEQPREERESFLKSLKRSHSRSNLVDSVLTEDGRSGVIGLEVEDPSELLRTEKIRVCEQVVHRDLKHLPIESIVKMKLAEAEKDRAEAIGAPLIHDEIKQLVDAQKMLERINEIFTFPVCRRSMSFHDEFKPKMLEGQTMSFERICNALDHVLVLCPFYCQCDYGVATKLNDQLKAEMNHKNKCFHVTVGAIKSELDQARKVVKEQMETCKNKLREHHVTL